MFGGVHVQCRVMVSQNDELKSTHTPYLKLFIIFFSNIFEAGPVLWGGHALQRKEKQSSIEDHEKMLKNPQKNKQTQELETSTVTPMNMLIIAFEVCADQEAFLKQTKNEI